MMIPAEYELAAAIVLIYLIDCVVLLYSNEGIVKRHGQRWRIDFGSVQPWIAGRRVALLHPLTPLIEAYRASWHIVDGFGGGEVVDATRSQFDARLPAWESLAPYVAGAWLLVLVALPLALCLRNTLAFVIIAAIAWASVWILVIRLWSLRGALGVSRGAFAMVAFECIACPPNAANLVRKLSMRMNVDTDLAALVVLAGDCAAVCGAMERIDREVAARLMFLEPETPVHARAVRYRTLLHDEMMRIKSGEESR